MNWQWFFDIPAVPAFFVSSFLVMLLTLDEQPCVAPDSAYYRALGTRDPNARVPVPFCFRPLVPWFLGTGERAWRIATVIGLIAQGVLMATLAGDARAAVLLLALPGGARFSVRCPFLVDPWALALTLGVAVAMQVGVTSPLWWFLLVLARESAPVWLAVYTGNPWPLTALLVLPLVRAALGRAAGSADSVFVQNPALCIRRRIGQWFNPHLMLIPWGVVLPLALMADWQTTVLVYLLASAPLLIATDTARIHQWAAPALIVLALDAPIPDVLWPVLLAIHLFNPYRGA